MQFWRFASLPRSSIRQRLIRKFAQKPPKAATRKKIVAEEEVQLSFGEKVQGKLAIVPAAMLGVGFIFLPLFYFNYSFLMRRLNKTDTPAIDTELVQSEEPIEEVQEAIILEVPDSPHLIQTQSEPSEEESQETVATTETEVVQRDQEEIVNETADNANEIENTGITSSEITNENESNSAAIQTYYENLHQRLHQFSAFMKQNMSTLQQRTSPEGIFKFFNFLFLAVAAYCLGPDAMVKVMHAQSTDI